MEYFNFDVHLKEMKILLILLVFIGVHKHKSAKEVVHARFAIPSGCTILRLTVQLDLNLMLANTVLTSNSTSLSYPQLEPHVLFIYIKAKILHKCTVHSGMSTKLMHNVC